jgi:hypothetical protein
MSDVHLFSFCHSGLRNGLGQALLSAIYELAPQIGALVCGRTQTGGMIVPKVSNNPINFF